MELTNIILGLIATPGFVIFCEGICADTLFGIFEFEFAFAVNCGPCKLFPLLRLVFCKLACWFVTEFKLLPCPADEEDWTKGTVWLVGKVFVGLEGPFTIGGVVVLTEIAVELLEAGVIAGATAGEEAGVGSGNGFNVDVDADADAFTVPEFAAIAVWAGFVVEGTATTVGATTWGTCLWGLEESTA